jgi:hypothetical protein
MKVVINRCHGGFSLSQEAEALYKERKGITDPDWYYWNLERDDLILVDIVNELGEAANGRYAELAIVDIPDDVDFQIEEYDGKEWVAEVHRTWY